jgi:acetoacetate decarboxylase
LVIVLVLRGGFRGFSTPFQAPLYTGPSIEYWDVEAVIVLGLFDRARVEALLPEGLEPAGDPVLGALWAAWYPFSTVGSYGEFLVALQVLRGSELGYYVPYIYVTNDAALAAGRELLGAPKKLAEVEVRRGVGSSVLSAMRVQFVGAP